jgi:hypothetical protein
MVVTSRVDEASEEWFDSSEVLMPFVTPWPAWLFPHATFFDAVIMAEVKRRPLHLPKVSLALLRS